MEDTLLHKMSRSKHYFIVGGCAIIVMIVMSFILFRGDYLEKHKPYDLEYIQDQNKLRVIVEPNTMSYKVIDVDSIEGLQVLMINSFAKAMNVKNVEIITEPNLASAIDMLMNHKVDILAWHIPIYNTMREKINYSIPVFTSRQMLVQRKHNPKDSVEFIRNQLGLADKKVYILLQLNLKLQLILLLLLHLLLFLLLDDIHQHINQLMFLMLCLRILRR